jgi:hypothetical protein
VALKFSKVIEVHVTLRVYHLFKNNNSAVLVTYREQSPTVVELHSREGILLLSESVVRLTQTAKVE